MSAPLSLRVVFAPAIARLNNSASIQFGPRVREAEFAALSSLAGLTRSSDPSSGMDSSDWVNDIELFQIGTPLSSMKNAPGVGVDM